MCILAEKVFTFCRTGDLFFVIVALVLTCADIYSVRFFIETAFISSPPIVAFITITSERESVICSAFSGTVFKLVAGNAAARIYALFSVPEVLFNTFAGVGIIYR